jgi:hypothetical protein
LPTRGSRLALASLLLLLAACSGPAASSHSQPPATPAAAVSPQSVDAVIVDVLDNIRQNGLNADPALNHGLGGLWINWRYGTSPLQANVNTSGQPNGDLLRHDYLTDLRYLHALWLYRSQHPADHQFDQEVTRYTAIIKSEFARPAEDHGWVYDEFIDLNRLSGDDFYRNAARTLAAHYARLFHADVGAIYWVTSDHPRGYYDADRALEIASALLQAGTVFAQPDWVSDGSRSLAFVYQHAYLPQDHVFLWSLDNVLNPDGTTNANETVFRPKGSLPDAQLAAHLIRDGGVVEPDEVAHIALSLMHAYQVTGDRTLLTRALDVLDPMTASTNRLGLWDSEQLGYFGAAIYPGPDVTHPGTPHVIRLFKESGRQIQLLEAFHVADQLAGGRFAAMETLLGGVAIQHAYYRPGHGFLYEQTADWQPLTLAHGVVSDWVTTEAMGCALEGLLSMGDAHPW